MNEYRVTCIIIISCQCCKIEVTAFGDNEEEAMLSAKEWALKVGKADSCKPLSAVFVTSL